MNTKFTQKRIEGFKGMNNRLSASSLPIDVLRNAVNVTFDNQGKPRMRAGKRQVYTGSVRSLWWDGDRFLFVDNGTIKYFRSDTLEVGTIGTCSPNIDVAFVKAAGDVYWSDGVVTGKVNDSLWGIPVGPTPVVSALTTGGLSAGRYHVAVTQLHGQEEGGAPKAVPVDVLDGGGILATGLPGTPVRVYVSQCNGELLFRYADTSATTVNIQLSSTLGAQIRTMGAYAFPPCTILEYFNGRIYGARANVLFYTMGLQYRLCRLHQDYVAFPSNIKMVKAVVDGLFVSDQTTTWYLPAQPDGEPLGRAVLKLPYAAVPGTAITIKPTHDIVAWFSDRGWVMGQTGGDVKNVSEKDMALNRVPVSGAATFREQNGVRELVSSFQQADRSQMVVSDYAEAEIVRNGENIV